MKRYFDLNYNGEKYDAVKLREEARSVYYKQRGGKPPAKAIPKVTSASSSGPSKPAPKPRLSMAPACASSSSSAPASAPLRSSVDRGPRLSIAPTSNASNPHAKVSSGRLCVICFVSEFCPVGYPSATENKENLAKRLAKEQQLQSELKSMKEEVTDLKETLSSMEKERDYYYNKLRQIELLCQQSELTNFVREVQDIMYDESPSTPS